jgi:hypothetical protein
VLPMKEFKNVDTVIRGNNAGITEYKQREIPS